MSNQKFTLNDGREVTIQYTQNKGFGSYAVLIDGEVQEKNTSCGRGWSHKTIEAKVREKYDTQKDPEKPAPIECIADPETRISPKKDNGAVDFKLEGLLGIADIKLMLHKPKDRDMFLASATELRTTIQQITELARKTGNKELKQRAEEMRTKYQQSDYYNY